MGLLRLLLAVNVALWHSPEGMIPRFIHPALAVQCFYAISGFLIQMAIVSYRQKNSDRWQLAFYKSRLLRLMPLYWLFTLLTLAFFGNGRFKDLISSDDLKGAIIYLINNFLIFGQDILRVLTYDTVTHSFAIFPPYTENLSSLTDQHIIMGGGLTILGQSWTLAVELWFYLFAPILLFLPNIVIIGLIVASLLSRFTLAYDGYTYHNFLYGIIFNELGVFLFGALAARFYKFYLKGYSESDNPSISAGIKIWGLIVYVCLLHYYFAGWRLFPDGGKWGEGLFGVPYAYWAVIAFTVLALPFLFAAFGQQVWDRFLGDLSYPMYISHVFILLMLEKTAISKQWLGTATIATGLIISTILLYLIEKPLDNVRHRLFRKATISLQ